MTASRRRSTAAQVRVRDPHQDLLLQGLQDGAGDQDLQLQGLQDGARATHQDRAATRSARWCLRRKTCCYKVCHMVPEQRTCSYKVCHMVPEQRTCMLQGLQHGARATRPAATRSARWCPSNARRPAATRSATWCPSSETCCYKVCHMVPEQRTCTLQGLQDGARATHQDRVLHGVQAGVRAEDGASATSASPAPSATPRPSAARRSSASKFRSCVAALRAELRLCRRAELRLRELVLLTEYGQDSEV